jgi:hypothetical protein
MWQEIKFNLTSSGPMIMHNGDLANPMNPIVKEIKKISSKRAKTEADFEQMAHLEFLGGLYLGENGSGLAPVIPAQNIEKMLILAARKKREGKLAETGMFVSEIAALVYDGPTDPEELWLNKDFVYQKMVVVQRSRVLRTRPIFNQWSAVARVNYEPDIANHSQVVDWMKIGGFQIGQMEWRPRYGRFDVEVLE